MLSVIVVGRDVAEHVGTCLRSVAMSDTRNFEVIFVDDGSIDDSAAVVDHYASLLPDVQIIRHEQPCGPARARNTGLDRSSGDHLTFLDADDWIAPDYLSALQRTLSTTGADFVRADHVQVRSQRRLVHRVPEWRREAALDPRSGIGRPGQFSPIDYPYNSIGGFHGRLRDSGLLRFSWPSLHTAEDRPWLWRLHLQASSYAVASVLGHFYRRGRPSSLTGVGDERQLMYLDAYDVVLQMARGDTEADRVYPKALDQFLRLGIRHLKLEDRLTPRLREAHRGRLASMIRRLDPLDDSAVRAALGAEVSMLDGLVARDGPQ